MTKCRNCGNDLAEGLLLPDELGLHDLCDPCRKAWDEGFREGESKQAIISAQAQERFFEDLKAGKIRGTIPVRAEVPKDCPKKLGDIVKHNGTTVNAAYQWGKTMHHDVDVLIEELSKWAKGLESTVKELTNTLNDMTRK